MKKVLISIDMDFFYRELPEWDFGHSEQPFFISELVWNTRYQTVDLYGETDPIKFADVHPLFIFTKLKALGFKFTHKTIIGGGWSHSDAYKFFRDCESTTIFNLDAHHDLFNTNSKVDCANWLFHLQRDSMLERVVWVVPKWSEGLGWYSDPKGKIEVMRFADLEGEGGVEVEAIYLAQSPAWLPPHLDETYEKTVDAMLTITRKKLLDYDGKYAKRSYPTKAEASDMLKQYKKMVNTMRKKAARGG